VLYFKQSHNGSVVGRIINSSQNPGRGENEQPPISDYYKEVTTLCHLIQSGNFPLAFNYTYESLFYEARASVNEGRQINEAENHNEELKKIQVKMRTSKYFAMDGSKNGEQTIRRIRIDKRK
jgi:hypothetical protein